MATIWQKRLAESRKMFLKWLSSYVFLPAKTYTEPSPFFNAFERKGPAVAAKNDMASTVETLKSTIQLAF